MLIAYVDESGDPSGDPNHRGSPSYTLGVVVVKAEQWADAFDGLINMRRSLKSAFGVPARSEIKAHYLVRAEGSLKGMNLSGQQRRYIYQRHFQMIERMEMRAFAIWVDKRSLAQHERLAQTRWLAWESLFQRLSTMHDRDDAGRKSPVLLIHDEGEDLTIRKYARRARRFLTSGSAFGPGSLRLSQRWLIDDPVARNSDHSLFIQCADLVAYSAAQRMLPSGSRARRVCPQETWSRLGTGCHHLVNQQARMTDPSLPAGIVVRK